MNETAFNPWNISPGNISPGNPYAPGLQSGMNNVNQAYTNEANAMPSLQAGLNTQMGQMQTMGANQYPSYPNSAGAGNQLVGVPQAIAPQVQGAGDMGMGSGGAQAQTTYGLNPWSLTGEALSRK